MPKQSHETPRITEAPDKGAERVAVKLATLKKLAMKRVPRTVKAIQLVGNLVTYSPTPAQKEAILNALATAVEEVRVRFKDRSEGTGFSLE